jgi:hypothetical protein
MSALPEHFAELVRSTVPDGERLAAASEWPGKIREHIQAHDFETVSPHHHLVGSYARSTAVGDIKDVDVVVFLPVEREEDSSRDVLSELEAALKEFPDATIDTTVQRRSVRVTVGDFDLDVVPAIIREDDHHGVLLIPDKTREEWIESRPIGYSDALASLNQTHNQKVKPQVRLLKTWRNGRMVYMKPKSYLLECLVYHAFNDGKVAGDGLSHGPLFADLLEHLVDRLGPTIDAGGVPNVADPMTGKHVSAGWEHSHAKALLTRLREDAAIARKAVDADDEDEAIELWSRVFPDDFPTDSENSKSALREHLLSGKGAVTPAGVLLNKPRPGAVPLPRTHAYGDRVDDDR